MRKKSGREIKILKVGEGKLGKRVGPARTIDPFKNYAASWSSKKVAKKLLQGITDDSSFQLLSILGINTKRKKRHQ